MPAPESILETTRAIANQWRSLAFGFHVLFALAALCALAGWRPQRAHLAALVLLPFVTVMTLAWTSRNTFTAFVFLIATVALIAVAATFEEQPAARGSRMEVVTGALLIGVGWCYPHFLDGGSWLRYLYEAPLGIVPCATLSLAAGISIAAGGLGSRAWSLMLAAVAGYYGLVGVFVLGVPIDAALIAGAVLLIVNAAARRNFPLPAEKSAFS